MINRRTFLRGAAAIAAASATSATLTPGRAQAEPAAGSAGSFRLGMAGFTFAKFKLDPTLEMLQKLDVHYLCIKDFHLALNSTEEEIKAFHEKCRSHGVEGYGVGPIYMGSAEEVDKAFAYAKRVGVKIVVGVPFKKVGNGRAASTEILKLVNDKVQEYDVKYAIHNHGPDMPDLFPCAESIMSVISSLDRRIGLCLDIGHEYRDGKDPVKTVEQYAARVHDIHLKNVTAANKSGRGVELPRGAIDLVAFVRTLRKVDYQGMCSLEYEKDMDAPLTGIAECVGYFRGVMDAVRA